MSSRNKKGKTLVIGALGQIGQELLHALYDLRGPAHVVASDIRFPSTPLKGAFEKLDIMNKEALIDLIEQHEVDEVYNLAAILSAKGEQNPLFAWELNMTGLLNTLEAAHVTRLKKIFWPSSIAVFGPHSPRNNTPQYCPMDPSTVYGLSKMAGERWCEYYATKYQIDVRSIRYPGLISYKSLPGGGTTDYAVEIFHEALKKGTYTCYLKADTPLPMMYMPDAIKATLSLMEAPAEQVPIRSSYNLSGFSFSPAELVEAIQQYLPHFECNYAPDFRQEIADSWPASIDDESAQLDWGWKPTYDLEGMTKDMIENLRVAVPQ